jgi:CRISPR/Cas system-associated endoribonuclease Cas2
MQYVVCYDIADDRRRDRIASALLGLRAAGSGERIRGEPG